VLLALPYLTTPLSCWPLFPVAASGDSYFVLGEGYSGAGQPEDPKRYLAYCRAGGVFRRNLVRVPTREQAKKDVMALHDSQEWKAIQWNDSTLGTSYAISEESAWGFIEAQADAIK
jgi:hypothetical protein